MKIQRFEFRTRSLTPLLNIKLKNSYNDLLPLVQSKENFAIGIEDYEVIRVLGKGSYATVRLGIYKPKGDKVAIKSYEKAKPQVLKNIKNEINVLRYLDHPNILKLFDVRHDNKGIHLVLEYVVGSSLENYLKIKSPNQAEIVKIFKQILSAVNYCHSIGVIHRDLKLSNILIDSGKRIKIIDFGFSRITDGSPLKLFCGTPEYMAPEIASHKAYNGYKVDVWALGVILFVLLTKSYPFSGRNEREILRKIALGCFNNIVKIPNEAISLVKKLLLVDPLLRISAQEALNDP